MSIADPALVQDEEIERRAAALDLALKRHPLKNPPPPDIESLDIDDNLKRLLSQALSVSSETEIEASTILHQRISEEQKEFSEHDLLLVAKYLEVDDVPGWFEELGSWL